MVARPAKPSRLHGEETGTPNLAPPRPLISLSVSLGSASSLRGFFALRVPSPAMREKGRWHAGRFQLCDRRARRMRAGVRFAAGRGASPHSNKSAAIPGLKWVCFCTRVSLPFEVLRVLGTTAHDVRGGFVFAFRVNRFLPPVNVPVVEPTSFGCHIAWKTCPSLGWFVSKPNPKAFVFSCLVGSFM